MGYRLERIGPQSTPQTAIESEICPGYYRPPPTCQITELASLYSLYLGEQSEGFFVEVGAYDGISFSNSSCLAEAGWSGILIEPIPEFAHSCRNRYATNEGIKVVEAAIGERNGIATITVAGSLTTTNTTLLQSYKDIEWAQSSVSNTHSISVSLRTLDDVLRDTAAPMPIDVLIVDVEGSEESVFKGFTFQTWRPKMIIAELAHTHPDLHEISLGDANLQKLIQDHGYSIVYKDKINIVFVLEAFI